MPLIMGTNSFSKTNQTKIFQIINRVVDLFVIFLGFGGPKVTSQWTGWDTDFQNKMEYKALSSLLKYLADM